MSAPLQLLGGFAAIAALLAAFALAFYAIWWMVLLVVARVPIIGKRARHRDWEALNRHEAPDWSRDDGRRRG